MSSDPSPTAFSADEVALSHADDEAALAACFPIIRQLRPALLSVDDWTSVASQMAKDGYRVLAAWRGQRVLALAGYRIARNLIHGRFLYVDDLVTNANERGTGLGAKLLDGLTAIGADEQCDRLVLDTAATNHAARRFYARQGLLDAVVGFIKPLAPAP